MRAKLIHSPTGLVSPGESESRKSRCNLGNIFENYIELDFNESWLTALMPAVRRLWSRAHQYSHLSAPPLDGLWCQLSARGGAEFISTSSCKWITRAICPFVGDSSDTSCRCDCYVAAAAWSSISEPRDARPKKITEICSAVAGAI